MSNLWPWSEERKGKYRTERCPVCKEALGSRYFNKKRSFHCKECTAVFTFLPSKYKPTAVPDRLKPEYCTCFACQSVQEKAVEKQK